MVPAPFVIAVAILALTGSSATAQVTYNPTSERGWLALMPDDYDGPRLVRDSTPPDLSDGPWGDFRPNQMLEARDGNLGSQAVVAFQRPWIVEDGERRAVWIAQLRLRQWDRTLTRYADSRRCPMLVDALTLLEDLDLPRPYVADIPRGSRAALELDGIALDDVDYTITTQARSAGNNLIGTLKISGGTGSPAGTWGRLTLASLALCWSRERPEGVTERMIG